MKEICLVFREFRKYEFFTNALLLLAQKMLGLNK